MWITRFFRSKMVSIDRTEEPSGLSQPVCADSPTHRVSPSRHDDIAGLPGARADEDPILELLGSHLDERGQRFDPAFDPHTSPEPASIDGNGLLGALYAHYCKALDTPQSLMSGTWVPSSLGTAVSAPAHELPESWDVEAGGAISGLFTDIDRVDQAFGALGSGEGVDLGEHEGVPEILRLFAPPEYRTKPSGESIRPPALTQREHHTLAIDSPLTELNGAQGKTSNPS